MRDQDETLTGRSQHEAGNEASDEPPTVRIHPASVPVVAPRPSQADAVVAPGGHVGAPAGHPAEGPSITPPTAQPGGGLNTYLGQPSSAEHAAQKARAAQDSAQADTASVARSLAEIAGVLHDLAGRLEPFVEGSYSTDLADPRNRALAQSLSIARQADLHLARLGNILRRLSASVQVAQSNLDALQRERERLSTLYHIAQELNSSLDLEELLGSVTAELIEVVRAERGFLMLWDEAAGQLRFMAARGADGLRLAQADFSISYGVVDRVWQSQEPLLTVDAQDDTRLQSQVSIIAYGIRSVMCAPLRVKGHGVGIVYVDSRSESALFDATHLDLLAAFCNQAAIAIENARLFADLRRHIREISAMKTYTDNIFASIASGVVTADMLGVVTAFNRAAERIFGLVGASAVGRPYQEVLASIGDEELAEIMRRAVTEREVTLGHEIARRLPARAREGEIALRLNVSPLRSGDGAGEALGVAMVVDDLTELRRSQQQAREIQRLFGRYVHPAVVRQLLADPSAVNLGGETREISVV
ncbi:MAG TPA: GAF domain-containing protein, partial [Ktedonobacterales bacterium]|nr:GAF domain-containing protein [Ktedonobacterales bacterium]